MFRLVMLAVVLFAVSRFVWGIRQGYLGRTIEHPARQPDRETRRP
ncbi:MAG TPA: hypothetical protein VGD59_01850 [Acidisarcina sp.]